MNNVNSSAVKISNIFFSYEKGKMILKDLSLDIKAGEIFGIIGPTGAGKSTLLLHLNGILRGEGSVKIDDLEVDNETIPIIRKKVGLVFQNPDDQLFNPTVEEDVAFGPRNLGLSKEQVTYKVISALKAMNLQGFEKLSSHHLSFGEKKRVALATVLSMEPEIIAFDEPFSNLDPATVQQLLKIIKKLKATIIIVSQDILLAASLCHRLAVIKDGRVVKIGNSKDIVKERKVLKKCGLDFSFYCDACIELLDFKK